MAASGREMDCGRDLSGSTGHPAVGHQRDPVAAVLQHAERRGELVQLGHADRAGTLIAQYRDEVAVQLAGLEGGEEVGLVVEDDGRCGDHAMLGFDRRGLDHARTEVARKGFQPTVGVEGILHAAQHRGVVAHRGAVQPHHAVPVELGFLRVAAQSGADDGLDVLVQQAGIEQRRDGEAEPAGGVEVVHVRAAVRVDPGQQRNDRREFGDVVPGQRDSGGLRDGDQVHGVVGRAAGGEQRDAAVDDRAFVDHLADRGVVVAEGGDPGDLAAGFGGQRGRAAVCPGLTKLDPGRCRPITSISSWLELAVPKKVQVPLPWYDAASASRSSSRPTLFSA